MFLLLHVLVLAAEPASATEQYQAETVYAIDFEEAADVNYDQWPDNWTRRRGIGFPQYVKIQIAEDADSVPRPSHCLRIDQDGGGAAAFSPPIDIKPRCSYVFDGYLKTEDLKLNVAYFSVTFYNTERTRKECHTSDEYRGTSAWQHVRIGPIAPTIPDVTVAVIGVHSVPTTGSDLRGAAMFDELRLARLPRVEVATSSKHGLYFDRRDVVVTCDVSGLEQRCSAVSFELLDVAGNTVAAHQTLLGEESGQADSPVAEPSGTETRVSGDKEVAEGRGESTTWRPPIPDQGFYRVRVSIRRGSDLAFQRTVSLAILEEFPAGRDGEFGWSIPFGEDPLAMNELAELLAKAGVARVKYPVWHGPLDDEALRRVGTFADQLNALGIDLVAVLGQPPAPGRRTVRRTRAVAPGDGTAGRSPLAEGPRLAAWRRWRLRPCRRT